MNMNVCKHWRMENVASSYRNNEFPVKCSLLYLWSFRGKLMQQKKGKTCNNKNTKKTKKVVSAQRVSNCQPLHSSMLRFILWLDCWAFSYSQFVTAESNCVEWFLRKSEVKVFVSLHTIRRFYRVLILSELVGFMLELLNKIV